MKQLRIGIGLGELAADGAGGIDGTLDGFRRAEEAGFQTAWMPNIFGLDALSALALAGARTSRIELGTAVVPTYTRHPLYMAQQALTTQLACGGRLALGLGPSHKIVVENMLGLSYTRVAKHVEEYVTIVRALVETGAVDFQGELHRVKGALRVPGARPMPILIGGLGPRMRRLAGALADGTITWMTGPRALERVLVPEIRAAAREAGRPSPRSVCGLPIVVTNDAAGAREAASKAFALYGQLPSYRAMLDLEGAAAPGEVAIAGDERAVEAALLRLSESGVTDLNAAIFPYGPEPKETTRRTYELLAELARR